jgi:hypothetical protein
MAFMPIKHSKGSTTITGDSITFLRLAALKGAVGLELKGDGHRPGTALAASGGSPRALVGHEEAKLGKLSKRVVSLLSET